MTDFAGEVQTAVYDALTAASPTIAGGRVYDDVPDKPDYPFIEISDGQLLTDDTTGAAEDGDRGIQEFIDIHVWSRYRGKKEIYDLNAEIYDALHLKSLTVTGRASALSWVRTTRNLRDNDGITRHSVITVEIIHRS